MNASLRIDLMIKMMLLIKIFLNNKIIVCIQEEKKLKIKILNEDVERKSEEREINFVGDA